MSFIDKSKKSSSNARDRLERSNLNCVCIRFRDIEIILTILLMFSSHSSCVKFKLIVRVVKIEFQSRFKTRIEKITINNIKN